jgi:hypothetical protein
MYHKYMEKEEKKGRTTENKDKDNAIAAPYFIHSPIPSFVPNISALLQAIMRFLLGMTAPVFPNRMTFRQTVKISFQMQRSARSSDLACYAKGALHSAHFGVTASVSTPFAGNASGNHW